MSNTPLFFVPEDESVGEDAQERPPGLLVLCQSIGPNNVLSSELLQQLGLKPATPFAMVMATLDKIEEAVRSRPYNGFSEEEHELHVQQVYYVLATLEQLNREERADAIAACRKKLSLHTYGISSPRTQPLEPVTKLYLHSSELENLFRRGQIKAFFVNRCYLPAEKAEIDSLCDTLQEIGAVAGPKLEELRSRRHRKDEAEFNWPKVRNTCRRAPRPKRMRAHS